MTKIEEMIAELCSNGVEWKELGEVCDTVVSPIKLKRNEYQSNGAIAIIDQGEEFVAGYIDIEKYLPKDEYVIFGDHSEHIKFVNFPFVQGADGLKILKSRQGVIPKFLYYCFCNFYKKEGNYKRHWSVARTTPIPIPPLEIQKEIVQILDKFTEYVTELTAELTDRQKQYSFYRDKLLSFEDEIYRVEWKTLGELFEFKNGLNKGKEFFGRGTPIVNYTDVYKNIRLTSAVVKGTVEVSPEEQKRYNVRRGDVFFTRTSETKEEIGKTSVLLEDIDGGVFSGFVLRARPKTDSLLPEYCAHCFNSSSFRKEIVRYSTYTTRALTNGSTLAKLTIPLPPLPIQERIVQVLDNFDAVCNDLNIGLPKEIELRQKQYEYFREKLLTFTAEGVYPGQWTVDSGQ